MTEQPPIYEALAAVKKSIGAVGKSERNQQQGWNFRGIDAVLNAVSGPLAQHGVTVYPQLQDYTYATVEVGRNKTQMAHVIVKVKYIFLGPKGDSFETAVAAESMDSGDKAMTKAFSVALRTALIQTLSLPTDEPDPDHEVYERSGNAAETASKPVSRPAAPKAKAEAPKAAETPPAASEGDIAKLAESIKSAKTASELNALYTRAGSLGALQAETGGSTIQQMLYDRNERLKSSKSS